MQTVFHILILIVPWTGPEGATLAFITRQAKKCSGELIKATLAIPNSTISHCQEMRPPIPMITSTGLDIL